MMPNYNAPPTQADIDADPRNADLTYWYQTPAREAYQQRQTAPATDTTTEPDAAWFPDGKFNGDYQGYFNYLFPGGTLSAADLKAKEAELQKAGITLHSSTSGDNIQLPDGTLVDVIHDAGGLNSKVWQTGGGATSSPAMPSGDWFASNLPAPEPYTAPARPDELAKPYEAPTFNAPTLDDLLGDPGYLAGESAMQRGLERSAASRGTLLSGGFAGRALPRALGEYAGNAYGNLYGQRYQAFAGNSANALGARSLNENAFQNDVGNFSNQYAQRYKTYRDAIGDQQFNARLGLDATLGSRP